VEQVCFILRDDVAGVVLENTHVESGCIYAGVPAKKVKDIDPEQVQRLIEGIANNYIMYSSWFKEETE
jgi:carbonic anhydrase/acetyltransferase-like protein (isoleucine patch superfamily)